ncbi:hypothetical protein [Bacteroides sp.]|uniref:hypothetical protein n=1 Tax=Bacteroides sp. TaxID=29523 RepID=UPI003A94F6BE
MKKLIMLLIAVTTVCMPIMAQKKKGKETNSEKSVELLAEERVTALQKELALTDKQFEKLLPIYEKFYKESKKYGTGREAKQQMSGLRKEVNKKVEKLLNEDQLMKFRAKQEKMSQRGANRKRKHQPLEK